MARGYQMAGERNTLHSGSRAHACNCLQPADRNRPLASTDSLRTVHHKLRLNGRSCARLRSFLAGARKRWTKDSSPRVDLRCARSLRLGLPGNARAARYIFRAQPPEGRSRARHHATERTRAELTRRDWRSPNSLLIRRFFKREPSDLHATGRALGAAHARLLRRDFGREQGANLSTTLL